MVAPADKLEVQPLAGLGEAQPLVVAAGTPFELTVYDARMAGPWSKYEGLPRFGQPRLIVYHHTAGGELLFADVDDAITSLRALRDHWPYGVPYNVIVVRAPELVALYLNDVDLSWPHTLGHNDAMAICALGNFEDNPPLAELGPFMGAIADAFATMWGTWVPEALHNQISATACPGRYLSGDLRIVRSLDPPI